MQYPDWTPPEDAIIRQCAKQGMTAVEIFGNKLLPAYRAVHAIKCRSHKLKVYIPIGDTLDPLQQSLCGRIGFRSHSLPLNPMAEAFQEVA